MWQGLHSLISASMIESVNVAFAAHGYTGGHLFFHCCECSYTSSFYDVHEMGKACTTLESELLEMY